MMPKQAEYTVFISHIIYSKHLPSSQSIQLSKKDKSKSTTTILSQNFTESLSKSRQIVAMGVQIFEHVRNIID